jgi:hypothetical protein
MRISAVSTLTSSSFVNLQHLKAYKSTYTVVYKISVRLASGISLVMCFLPCQQTVKKPGPIFSPNTTNMCGYLRSYKHMICFSTMVPTGAVLRVMFCLEH